ncbi:hypothetical protein ACFRQM_42555 [Streptomyces sp. NPDC056831]|uniref:hypothetical protein n=1 Tax=Streptomyces sp. NPDC056831 TaxID=3345954 RepID=UPI0036AF813D
MFTLPPEHVRMLGGSSARYSMGLRTATVNGVTFWGQDRRAVRIQLGDVLDPRRAAAPRLVVHTGGGGGPAQQRTTERIVTALT